MKVKSHCIIAVNNIYYVCCLITQLWQRIPRLWPINPIVEPTEEVWWVSVVPSVQSTCRLSHVSFSHHKRRSVLTQYLWLEFLIIYFYQYHSIACQPANTMMIMIIISLNDQPYEGYLRLTTENENSKNCLRFLVTIAGDLISFKAQWFKRMSIISKCNRY